jgi:hypothetical protein
VTRKPAAEMPDSVRHFLRAKAHPARAIACPHCEAHEHRPCTTKSKRRLIADVPVHPARLSAWVRATAVCPTCQVEPGVDCHEAGRPLYGSAVHVLRQTEAEEMAA